MNVLKLFKKDKKDKPVFKEWYLNGKLHRVDGPAIIKHDGKKEWFLNGQRHRVDGPAINGLTEQKNGF